MPAVSAGVPTTAVDPRFEFTGPPFREAMAVIAAAYTAILALASGAAWMART
jgi:hypothetical protein